MKVLVAAVLLSLGSAWSAAAGDLRMEFQDGYVTLSAHDVPVRQILAEWARRGQTKITNGEKVMGTPVTLELKRVPEKQALEVVLHSVAGYLAAPRAAMLVGASAFDRIVVMPTSSAAPAMNGPRTQPPGMASGMVPPPYQQQPDVDLPPTEDSDEPVGPQMEQPTFGQGGEGQGPPMPAGANGYMGNQPGMQPNVVVPGAVPPPIPPDAATNPLRAYQPQQQQQQQQQPQNGEGTPQVQPPGPSPMQPGTVTNANPGQIQPQQQQQDPPQ